MGGAVGAGVGVVPGLGVGVGLAVGGNGGVGQPARAGLKGVGEGVAEGVVDADGVGVVAYGVYEGHVGRGVGGGACAPETTSEMATAIAPSRTVTTKVTAPHSRISAALMPATPLPRGRWPG